MPANFELSINRGAKAHMKINPNKCVACGNCTYVAR